MESVEQKLLMEIADKNQIIEELTRKVEENAAYRKQIEGRINRTAKDAVFLDLFSIPEYRLALYRELFPNDQTIRESDLQLFRVDRVLTNHPYNDVGILAREKIIVLAEAESEWSENIIYRLASCYFDTMAVFAERKSMNVHHKMKIDLLDVEAYVVYPGQEKLDQDSISLREVFFGGVEGKPDFTAKIIHGDYKGGIIAEYRVIVEYTMNNG